VREVEGAATVHSRVGAAAAGDVVGRASAGSKGSWAL